MMDADGAFRHLPVAGSIREQPAVDMEVLRIVRARWVNLQSEKLRSSYNGKH